MNLTILRLKFMKIVLQHIYNTNAMNNLGKECLKLIDDINDKIGEVKE